MANEIKLNIDGTEYEMEEVDWLPSTVPFNYDVPLIKLGNKTLLGKAIKKESKPIQDKGWEIVRYGTKEFNLPATSLIESEKKISRIFSVKRLLDNEVFNLGDNVYWYPQMTDDTTTLTEFRYITDTKNLNVYGKGFGVDFSLIQKVKPKVPLFTTTLDKVDRYEGERYLAVHKLSLERLDCNQPLGKPELWETAVDYKVIDNYVYENKCVETSYKEIETVIIDNWSIFDSAKMTKDRIILGVKDFFKSKINT